MYVYSNTRSKSCVKNSKNCYILTSRKTTYVTEKNGKKSRDEASFYHGQFVRVDSMVLSKTIKYNPISSNIFQKYGYENQNYFYFT